MIDIHKVRADTPGAEHCIHLNNAGASLVPEVVTRAMLEYLEFESITGGYEAAEQRAAEIHAFYIQCAQLINAAPHNIAFAASATDAFARALSSIHFEEGDVILTSNNDYISNQLAFLSFARRFGVRVERAQDLSEGGVDPTSIEDCIRRERPKLVSITHVPTNSGLIQDVAAIGEICHRHDILYLVDACQSAGQMPLDVNELHCDFLSATFRKFLRGPRGAGFLFVSDKVLHAGLEPLLIDMRGARWTGADVYAAVPDAKRFEEWEQNYALLAGAREAIRYACEIGLEHIRSRVSTLAADMRARLSQLDGVRVLDRGKKLCAITTSFVEGVSQETLAEYLRPVNIGFSQAEFAVIDFGEKQVPWALRAAPHYFNTEQEIDVFIECLEHAVRG